jgi:AraC-like DNA-binding protein
VQPAAIWKARKYIEENSSGELSLTKVANVVNMNANHLSENFKEVIGINFVEYVARIRFANTCDLLLNPKLRISEIAFAVGFQSLSQFNRIFKRLSGKSPTQYRAAAVCDGRTGKILRAEQENARKNA